MSYLEITLLLTTISFAIATIYLVQKNSSLTVARNAEQKEFSEKNQDLYGQLTRNKEITELKINSLTRELEQQKLSEKTIKEQFQAISQDTLLKALKELKNSSDREVGQVLRPFNENLKNLKTQIEKFYINEEKERFALKKEIGQVVNVGNLMSQETANLTNALKGDSKTQGDWGEAILERILEFSGLENGVHFITQGEKLGLKDENGKRQKPDVIINLPEEKSIVIDSKVSLTYYERLFNEDEESLKKVHLRGFIDSIKNHIKDLSGKKYQHNDLINSPEFVLMFIPLDQAFGLAIKEDSSIQQFAYENSIILVSPTTLLATMKIIYSIWRQDYSTKNSEKIAVEAGKLYDKMVLFQEDMSKLGEAIGKSQSTFGSCMNKLSEGRGDILSRFEGIRKLGAKNQKVLNISDNEQTVLT